MFILPFLVLVFQQKFVFISILFYQFCYFVAFKKVPIMSWLVHRDCLLEPLCLYGRGEDNDFVASPRSRRKSSATG